MFPGVEIESTGDVMIRASNGGGQHTDMFTLLDVEALSTDYIAVCPPDSLCQLGLVGVKDSTRVTLTWPKTIKQQQSDLLTNITLHKHQSIQLSFNVDVTGLRVTASEPIAVFSGGQMTREGEDDIGQTDRQTDRHT